MLDFQLSMSILMTVHDEHSGSTVALCNRCKTCKSWWSMLYV